MSVNVATVDEESLSNGIKNLVRWGGAVAEMFLEWGRSWLPAVTGGYSLLYAPVVIWFSVGSSLYR